jgi:NADH-quinone oxidoreductase subunit A
LEIQLQNAAPDFQPFSFSVFQPFNETSLLNRGVVCPQVNPMTSAAYLPVLIQICLAAGVGFAILALKLVSSQRGQKNKIKDSAYECGVPAEGLVHTRFSVKFYLTALLFMLFDLEVVILIPWTFIYRDFLANHIAILTPMLVFIGVLVLGLVYEVKKGALEWEK